MYCLRESRPGDLEELYALLKEEGRERLFSKEELLSRIRLSQHSFESFPLAPGRESYLFTLEESDTKAVLGASELVAYSPVEATYHLLSRRESPSSPLQLQLLPSLRSASELSLELLSTRAKEKGLSSLLSRGRLLYLADNLIRFHKTLVTYVKKRAFPLDSFWKRISQASTKLSYEEAEALFRRDPEEFFSLLQRDPLPLSSLKEPLEGSSPLYPFPLKDGLEGWLDEGFLWREELHPLDGALKLEAPLLSLRSLKEGEIGSLSSRLPEEPFLALVATPKLPFRATICPLEELPHGEIALPHAAWFVLQAEPGDALRYQRA